MSGPNQRPIESGLSEVQARVAAAAKASGRSDGDVTLIAVSKTHPAKKIEQAIAAGQRHFGENRVQEAQEKWPALKEAHPDIVLHLIGGLQSNKAKDSVELFDVIHSVDRPKLARSIVRHAETFEPIALRQFAQEGEVKRGGFIGRRDAH